MSALRVRAVFHKTISGVCHVNCSLAPGCSRLLSSEHTVWEIQKDHILIGTAVSEHVIREMSKSVVPLVKAL